MSSPTDETELQGIYPEHYSLPSTHVVRTVKDRYIMARVLYDYLQKKWPGNAMIDAKLDYNIYIAPSELTEDEIRELQRKTNKEKKKAKEAAKGGERKK